MSDEEKAKLAAEEAAARARKRRIRALIVGAVAAGGAFQLTSWQAQAHGNRSSHRTYAVKTAPLQIEGVSGPSNLSEPKAKLPGKSGGL